MYHFDTQEFSDDEVPFENDTDVPGKKTTAKTLGSQLKKLENKYKKLEKKFKEASEDRACLAEANVNIENDLKKLHNELKKKRFRLDTAEGILDTLRYIIDEVKDVSFRRSDGERILHRCEVIIQNVKSPQGMVRPMKKRKIENTGETSAWDISSDEEEESDTDYVK